MRLTIVLVATAAAGLLMTGCTTSPEPSETSAPSNSASPSASASPTSSLPAADQQAVDQATEAVRAYEQMFYDILADPEPNLNDLNEVAAQPQLAGDLKNLQKLVDKGGFTLDSTGPIVIVSAEPVSIELDDDPPTVVLQACVDKSAASGEQDGKPFSGARQEARYEVVKTTYLAAPGWAVANVLPPDGFDQPQPC